jgi:NAD(P)-dependent dehydrogenase (short-subunit alcohol dehydrogenase family)
MATNKHNARRWVLVTGGNKGIGRAVCERILTEWSDAGVVMGSRDATRGEEAARDVLKATSTDPSRLRVLEVDTSSDESVRRAAQKLRSTLGAKEGELAEAASEGQLLYGIVNNAGVRWKC